MKILFVTLEEYLGFLDTGIINTYLPLKEMAHEVLLFDYTKNESSKLIEKCKDFNPDLIIYCLSEKQIKLEDMLFIKDNLKINSFCVNVDCVWRYGSYFTEFAQGVNYVVTTEKSCVEKYKKDFSNLKDVIFCTLWANDKVFFPINYDKIYDVSFVGRFHGKRDKLLNFLVKSGINLKVLSNVKNYNEVNRIYNQSKLVLSPSLSSDCIHQQDKLRFYEITASGACILTDYCFSKNGNSFNESEFVYYQGENDIIDKIKYYLKHDEERKKVAEMGHLKFKKEHTSKIKLEKILKRVTEDS